MLTIVFSTENGILGPSSSFSPSAACNDMGIKVEDAIFRNSKEIVKGFFKSFLHVNEWRKENIEQYGAETFFLYKLLKNNVKLMKHHHSLIP